MQMNRSASLARLLSARSIAVVGASEDLVKPGGRVIASLLLNNYSGTIYPVNPGRSMIQGLTSYPSLTALPDAPDMVILSVPAKVVEASIRDGLERGAGGFVVFASGFAEKDAAGAEAQQRIAALVKARGVPMIGPNCLGVMNGSAGILASSTIVMRGRRMLAGNCSLISQSGAIGTYWLDMMMNAGHGMAKWLSTGNEADIDVAAAAAYLAEDPDTQIIALYVEGIRDGVTFRRAARRAAAARKPVVVLKSGRSAAGAIAAASHTGALAGADDAYDALFTQFNICRVESMTAMVNLTRLLLTQKVRPGRRMLVLSVSGGAGVLLTDAAQAVGLETPDFPPESKAALRAILPDFAQPQNPIDLTAQIVADRSMLRRALQVAVDSGVFDGLLLFVGGLSELAGELAEALNAIVRPWGRPCAVVWQAVTQEAVRTLNEAGLPVYDEIPEAAAAMAAALGIAEGWERKVIPAEDPSPRPAARVVHLTEQASKTLLAEGCDVARPRGILLTSADGAAARLAELRAPLVAKLQSGAMLHKSGHGGIVLHLPDAAAAADATGRLLALARERGLDAEGVLVEEMVGIGLEFVLGIRDTPVFGPMLTLGRGGVEVEVDPDVVMAYLPLGPAEIEALIQRLRVAPLLRGFRGRPAANVAGLAEAVHRICEFYLANPELREIEINPLILDREGRVLALDALIARAGGEHG